LPTDAALALAKPILHHLHFLGIEGDAATGLPDAVAVLETLLLTGAVPVAPSLTSASLAALHALTLTGLHHHAVAVLHHHAIAILHHHLLHGCRLSIGAVLAAARPTSHALLTAPAASSTATAG
jgi:hypothetical protein